MQAVNQIYLVALAYSQIKHKSGDILTMSNSSVINELTRDGFEFIGSIHNLDLDYFELIEGDWYLGCICSENMIVAFSSSIAWGLDCYGESDTETRWNATKKMIRTALKQLPIAA